MGYWVKEEWQKKIQGKHVSILGWWATRLRKRGKKREKIRGGHVRVLGRWAILGYGREGKKGRVEECVRVLGWLLG